jgi:hypothetical protein
MGVSDLELKCKAVLKSVNDGFFSLDEALENYGVSKMDFNLNQIRSDSVKSDLRKFTDLLDELGIEYWVNEPNEMYEFTSRRILLVDGWGIKVVYHFDPKTNMVLREENRNKFPDDE